MFVYQPALNVLELKKDKGNDCALSWKSKGLFNSRFKNSHENILIYDISYKTLIGPKPMRIRFDKTYDGNKLVKTKTNSKYLIRHIHKDIKPLVFIVMMSGYVKTFKVEDKINKLMSFRIDNEALLEKNKTIWTKIEDDRFMKTKIRTYGDKFYTNIRGLNVPEDDIECESFTVISIDSLLVYENKYYSQVYLDNCAYKIINKQLTDYLDENIFED